MGAAVTDLTTNRIIDTVTAPVPKNYRRRWRRVLWRTAKAVTQMETSMRCAGIAYFGFLSLFPAISTVVLLIGLLASPQFLADMIDRLDGLVPKVAQQALASQLVTLLAQPRVGLGIGLVISLVVALWSGSRGVAALIYATSQTRQEPERRGLIMTVVVSVLTTLAGALAMVVALTLVAVLPAFFSLLPWLGHNQAVLLLVRWPLLLVLGVLAIAAFYRFAPDRRSHRARWIWPGAIVATVLWLAVCALFSLYVESIGNFQATFGSLATAIVLLLWMYNSALILVLGATLNAQLEFETLAERAKSA
jgi:membrane protein